MSTSTPDSRDALFGLLSELARGDATPERLAAAREGIRLGHLGDAGEASLSGTDGRPLPLLVWAASWGDLEMVQLLLEQGATPLLPHPGRDSALRAAHDRSAILQVVRRAAREASERGAPVCNGLATPRSERRYALRTARGVEDLGRAVDASKKLDVLLVEQDVKATVRALGNLVEAPRREADVAHRPVQDARRLVFAFRLKGIPWTIVPFVFEVGSPWNVEHVTELAAAGTGIAPIARALASSTGGRVVHVKHDEHTIYSAHGGIETRRADESDELGDDGSDPLSELGAFVPPMRVGTDGYHVQLELLGLDPSDVERVDVVVLQELGDRDVDRRTALPAAGPALVGAPVLLQPGLPPIVRPAEPAAMPSAAPPLVREPPPIVAEPAVSEAPPLMREPPPIVAPPPMVSPAASETPASEPPVVDAPKSEAPPRVSEPPAVVDGAKSEAPPMVSEPPPIVDAAKSGAPPMVSEPPAVVDATKSGAPPMVSAPPLVVDATKTETGSAASEPLPADARQSEPPPADAATKDAPPLVSEPPPLVSEPPRAAEPPPLVVGPDSTKSDAPPLVREPPPVVTPSDEPPEGAGG